MTTTDDGVDLGAGGAEAPIDHLASDRFAGLDGLRGLAALAVVATHVGFATGQYGRGTWGALLSRLAVGVAVFFVLSGFLLSRPWLLHAVRGSARPRAGAYLWRRALRILPAYWVAVLAGLTLVRTNRDATTVDWVRHLLLVQVYWPNWDRDGLSQMWSLCAEAAFYVVLPVIMAALLRRLRPWRLRPVLLLALAMTVVGLVTTSLTNGLHPVLPGQAGVWLLRHAGWFAGGIALAALSVQVNDLPPRLRPVLRAAAQPGCCWAAAGAVLWISTTPLAGPVTLDPSSPAAAVTSEVLYGTVALLLLLPLALPSRPGLLLAALDSPPLQRLGDLSYGIFLYHLVLLLGVRALLDQPLFTGSFWQTMLLTTAAAWLCAAVSRRFLERPAMRLRRLVPAASPLPQPERAGSKP